MGLLGRVRVRVGARARAQARVGVGVPLPSMPELDAKVEGMRKASSDRSSRGEFSIGVPVSSKR